MKDLKDVDCDGLAKSYGIRRIRLIHGSQISPLWSFTANDTVHGGQLS